MVPWIKNLGDLSLPVPVVVAPMSAPLKIRGHPSFDNIAQAA
jgi:hypothetical protein